MKNELALAQSTLEPEVIKELIRLNSKLLFAKELLSGHLVTTPLFDYLASSTPVTVRFKDFSLSTSERGLVLRLAGEARGYGALALQADIFNKNESFQNQLFSNFELNEDGDVTFAFNAIVDPRMLYFENMVADEAPVETTFLEDTATSTPN